MGLVLSFRAAVQVDNHIAELTVRETLDFAARVLGVGHKEGILCRCNYCACSAVPCGLCGHEANASTAQQL